MRIFRIIVIHFERAFSKGLYQHVFKLKFRRKCSLSVISSETVNTKHQCYVYPTPWSISPAYWWLQDSKLNSLLLHKTKIPVAKDSQNRWVSELFFSGALQYSFHSHPEHTALTVSNDISPHCKSETKYPISVSKFKQAVTEAQNWDSGAPKCSVWNEGSFPFRFL